MFATKFVLPHRVRDIGMFALFTNEKISDLATFVILTEEFLHARIPKTKYSQVSIPVHPVGKIPILVRRFGTQSQ
jgi:hypothetical protein